MASHAALSADVPARTEPPASRVKSFSGRSAAAARTEAFDFSAYGWDVEAKYSESTWESPQPAALISASTPMVMGSSSKPASGREALRLPAPQTDRTVSPASR